MNTARSAFTLVELMVVVAVIISLMATLFIANITYYRTQSQHQAAQVQVQAIATAIDGYGQRWYLHQIKDNTTGRVTEQRNIPMWDLPSDPENISTRDGLLDGEWFEDTVTGDWHRFSDIYPGYIGFLGHTGFDHQRENLYRVDTTGDGVLDLDTGMLQDPWGNPYRIRVFDPDDTASFGDPPINPYGAQWYGVWSAGPDGLDGTDDDINSWEMRSGR